MSNKKAKCCTCGYEWNVGADGSHSCSLVLQRSLTKVKEENAALKATVNEYRSLKEFNLDDVMEVINDLDSRTCEQCLAEHNKSVSIEAVKAFVNDLGNKSWYQSWMYDGFRQDSFEYLKKLKGN